MGGGWNIDNPIRDEDGTINEGNPLDVSSESSDDLMETNNSLLELIRANTFVQSEILKELKEQNKYLKKIYNPY